MSYPLYDKTVLDNGVRVISETIPSVRSVSVGLWVLNGSRNEAEEEAGISHFIEHMVFKGTQKRKPHHIARYLESVGGFLNAFTSKEYTCYYARALDEHLPRAIDVICDLVLNPVFPVREMEKEKAVVLEEIKMYEDVAEDLVFDRSEAVLYKNMSLGRPVIGYPDTVRSFSRDQLVDYLNTQYTPGNTVVVAAGNLKHERFVRLVEKAFAQSSRTPIKKEKTQVPAYLPTVYQEERPIQQAHLVLATRGYSIYNENRIALSVLNTILSGGMSSRLHQNIREKYGYCYNIYSFINLHSDTGDFGVYMGTDPTRIKHSTRLIFRELDKMAQKKVSARVLNQGISQVKGAIMLGLESMSNRMMRLGRHELFFGKYFTLDEVIDSVEQISADDVLEVAQELFVKDSFSHIVLYPATK